MADYIYLLQNRLNPAQWRAVEAVREAARAQGMPVFLVGGAVRDLTSGSPVRDMDFALQGDVERLVGDLEAAGATVTGRHPVLGIRLSPLPRRCPCGTGSEPQRDLPKSQAIAARTSTRSSVVTAMHHSCREPTCNGSRTVDYERVFDSRAGPDRSQAARHRSDRAPPRAHSTRGPACVAPTPSCRPRLRSDGPFLHPRTRLLPAAIGELVAARQEARGGDQPAIAANRLQWHQVPLTMNHAVRSPPRRLGGSTGGSVRMVGHVVIDANGACARTAIPHRRLPPHRHGDG